MATRIRTDSKVSADSQVSVDSERFDQAAAGWDAKPRRVELAGVIATAMIHALPLTKDMVAVEYGCGTGLVTLMIAEHVQGIHGLDRSTGMLKVLQEKMDRQGVTNVWPLRGGLADLPSPVDLILLSMTLHHIDDHIKLLQQCGACLKPGGFLALADLEQEDGSFHADNNGIAHFGFTPEVLVDQLLSCGFSKPHQQTIFTIKRNGRGYPVFLMTAQRS